MRLAAICLLLVACAPQQSTPVRITRPSAALFDCNSPSQRLSCADPADENRRFVCHATGSATNPWVKISVSRASPSHQPGAADGKGALDQAPGASGDDVGSGPGLDCECGARACTGACSGAAAGTACDDGDKCSGDGACLGDICQPGPPNCTAGTPVDACSEESGACDAASGECLTQPIAAGAACPEGYCDGSGLCVECLTASTCPGADTDCSARTCIAGGCGIAPAASGTICGSGYVCDGNGACVGVPHVELNEIESNGGVPNDWIELTNSGTAAADLTGWSVLDNDDAHARYFIPAGTTLQPGGYLVLEVAQFIFGLGAPDSVRLFDPSGALADSYAWTSHATTTYGRCPNATGSFTTTAASTKGSANGCGGGGGSALPWPGANQVTVVDGANVFGENLSDLFYQAGSPDVLWAVRNAPSTLFRLVFDGSIWTPEWGKDLHYPGGLGSPDAEGLTLAELSSPAVYVSTERNNDEGGVSRLSVLRFDTSAAAVALVATHEWNLTADLPAVGANLGLEALTWVPDSALVARAFFDEGAGHLYNPADYPNHGTGIFLVGLEVTGGVYAYALDHLTGAFHRVAAFPTGDSVIKALSYDRDSGYLWSACGSACGNQARIFTIGATGRFTPLRQYAGPTSMANLKNEGIGIAPDSRCAGGLKPFFWSDDGATDGHSIRRDSIPCGAF